MIGSDEGQLVRRDPEAENATRRDASATLVVRQWNEARELLQRPHRVAQLPPPVAPLAIGRLRKEAFASGGIGLHASPIKPARAREDAATLLPRRAAQGERARLPQGKRALETGSVA